MAGPEHYRHCWQLRLWQDLSGYGDRQVAKPSLGGDSGDGMAFEDHIAWVCDPF